MTPRNIFQCMAGHAAAALSKLLGSRSAILPGILLYHRIVPPADGLPQADFNVRPEQFARQLSGLLDRGFVAWPLHKLLEARRRSRPLEKKVFVVTFDDGFGCVHDYALPVLRRLKVPATVFLSTGYLDREGPFPFDPWGKACQDRAPAETYRPLTTEQCRALLDSRLVELGSHTHTHEDFRGRPEAFGEDLRRSTAVLAERFGLKEVLFAYPFGRSWWGYAGGQLASVARESGVACGLTTDCRGVNSQTDPFLWGRFNVYDFDTPLTLAGKLTGWYGWAPRVQEWLCFKQYLRQIGGRRVPG